MNQNRNRRVDVLGVGVDPIELKEVLERVGAFVRSGEKKTVHYANVYCVNIACKDQEYREILNQADLVYCDGYGIVLGAKIIGEKIPERMTGADWIHDLCRFCQEMEYSIYLMGSKPGIAEKASERLKKIYPSLIISGSHHGYLSTEERIKEAIQDVNNRKPNILLVGMGSPLQEKFVFHNRQQIDVPVCWSVGALFDFVAEIVPRAPKWMLDNGLEWLFRLIYEPRRMWGRYLVGNSIFLLKVLGIRLKRMVIPDQTG